MNKARGGTDNEGLTFRTRGQGLEVAGLFDGEGVAISMANFGNPSKNNGLQWCLSIREDLGKRDAGGCVVNPAGLAGVKTLSLIETRPTKTSDSAVQPAIIFLFHCCL